MASKSWVFAFSSLLAENWAKNRADWSVKLYTDSGASEVNHSFALLAKVSGNNRHRKASLAPQFTIFRLNAVWCSPGSVFPSSSFQGKFFSFSGISTAATAGEYR